MNYKDIDENELISMLSENDENVKNIIYEKYSYIIDILMKKYYRLIKIFHLDEQEIRCEASYGFSDGINSFIENKNASLPTFLTLCIERRITNYINKVTNSKHKIMNEAISLDSISESSSSALINIISDDNKFDPLKNLTEAESIDEFVSLAKNNLSDSEYMVFVYMANNFSYQEIASILGKDPKQIDNTIQRVKKKLRNIIN